MAQNCPNISSQAVFVWANISTRILMWRSGYLRNYLSDKTKKIRWKGKALTNTVFRCKFEWRIAVSTSAVRVQRLDKWNEFHFYALQWEAAPNNCTIGWIERHFQVMESKDTDLWTCDRSIICRKVKIGSIQPRSGWKPAWFSRIHLSRILGSRQRIMFPSSLNAVLTKLILPVLG